MRAETARGQTPASPAPAVETSPPMLPTQSLALERPSTNLKATRGTCVRWVKLQLMKHGKTAFARSLFLAGRSLLLAGAIMRTEAIHRGEEKDEHGQPCARRGPRLDQVHPPGRPCRRRDALARALSCVSMQFRAFVGSCGTHACLTLILGRRTRPAKNAMVS